MNMFRIRHTWLASILVLTTAAAAVANESIPWITDLAQARQLAEQQQRLVLLHFWGDGCQPCQQLEANVFNQPELIRVLSTNFVCVKIDIQQQPSIASYYKITKIPTDIIVLPSGAQVFRTTSPANVNQYIAMLDQVRANALSNGLQQADQVARNVEQTGRNVEQSVRGADQVARNAVQQFTSNLPLLGNRAEEQPAAQSVNNEN
jgi:thioredoxin-like negative regulator of GroEL